MRSEGEDKRVYKKKKVDHNLVRCVTEHGHPGHLPHSSPTPSALLCPLPSPRDPPTQTVPEVRKAQYRKIRLLSFGGLNVLPLSLKWERMDTPHDTAKEDKLPTLMWKPNARDPKTPGCGHAKPLTFRCNPCGQKVGHPAPSLTWRSFAHTYQGSFALRSFALAGSFC